METAVVAVRPAGPDTVAVEFETPAGFDASPGQFVRIGVGGARRFYTLSSPDDDDTFEVTVAVDPDGEVGPVLADADPGETVEVAGPFGDAFYQGEQRPVVLAGGPGAGAAVGIAERALAENASPAVVYQDEGAVHEDRLATLASLGADVWLLAPSADLGAAAAEAVAQGGTVFVYGFDPFVDAAETALDAAGFDGERRLESFGPEQ